jgi:1-acyl-sn-glycerol-3-phosphate acyltransferase
MLGLLPPFVRGVIALLVLALNTLFWCAPLFALSLVKLVLPIPAVRLRIGPALNAIATLRIACNSACVRLTQLTVWEVAGIEQLRYQGWYLVNSNHQSWVDIFVLQHVLNRRIPLLKFFLKQQLIYVQVIGIAWWALDFPFMRRRSKEALRKHPELRHQDREHHAASLREVCTRTHQRDEFR